MVGKTRQEVGGEIAIDEDKDESVREEDYLHECEAGVSGVDNTELEAW